MIMERKKTIKRASVVLFIVLPVLAILGSVGVVPGSCGGGPDVSDGVIGRMDVFFGPERTGNMRAHDRIGFLALAGVIAYAGPDRFASSFDRLAKALGTDRYRLFDNFASPDDFGLSRFYWFAKTLDAIMRQAGGMDHFLDSFRKLSGLLGKGVSVKAFKENPDSVLRALDYIPHIDELIFLLGREKIGHAFGADTCRFLGALKIMSGEKIEYYYELERFVKEADGQYPWLLDTPGIVGGRHAAKAKKVIRRFVGKCSSGSLALSVKELKILFLSILAVYENEFNFLDRAEYDAIAVRIIMNARFDDSYDADGSFLIGAPYVKSFSRAALVGVLAHEVAHSFLPIKIETEAAQEMIADLGNFSILTIMGYGRAIRELTLRYAKQVVDPQGECDWPIEPHHAARTQIHIIRQVLGDKPDWPVMFGLSVPLARRNRSAGFAELVEFLLMEYGKKTGYAGIKPFSGKADTNREACPNKNHLLTAKDLRRIIVINAAAK